MSVDCEKCGGNLGLCLGRCDETIDIISPLRECVETASRVLQMFSKTLTKTLKEINRELTRIQDEYGD